MYDYLLEAVGAFLKYGASPTALIVSLTALFKTKRVKRLLSRRIPWLFRDDADVLNYKDRQMRIEAKIDALAEKMGVDFCGALETGINGQKNSNSLSKSSPVDTYRENRLRRIIVEKFKSRKFWMAVVTAILVILNDGLDLGIDSETVLAFAGIVATFIIGESAIDASRVKKEGDHVITGDPGPAE